jgi:hypothetical protein
MIGGGGPVRGVEQEPTRSAAPLADPTPPANYTANTAPVVLDTHGTGNTVVIHGLVYIPRHDVNIRAINNARASNTPQLAGGLVCRTLIISVNNGSGTGSVAGLGSPVTVTTARTVVITATTGGMTEKAVVVVRVDANKTTTILSWRTVE